MERAISQQEVHALRHQSEVEALSRVDEQGKRVGRRFSAVAVLLIFLIVVVLLSIAFYERSYRPGAALLLLATLITAMGFRRKF